MTATEKPRSCQSVVPHRSPIPQQVLPSNPVSASGLVRPEQSTYEASRECPAVVIDASRLNLFGTEVTPSDRLLKQLEQAPELAAMTLKRLSTHRDDLGMTHIRLARMYEGLEVFGEHVVGHFNPRGELTGLTGERNPIALEMNASTQLTKEQAVDAVRAQMNSAQETGTTLEVEPIVFRNRVDRYVRGFKVVVADTTSPEPSKMVYLIGENGAIDRHWNAQDSFVRRSHARGVHQHRDQRPHVNDAAEASAATEGLPTLDNPATNDRTQYSGMVEISDTRLDDGRALLEDTSRGNGIVTYDQIKPPDWLFNKDIPIYDDNGIWGEPSDPKRVKPGVDAHYGAQVWYDVIKFLGWDSFDGRGMRIESVINFTHDTIGPVKNAFYNDASKQVEYGGIQGDAEWGPLTDLNVTGHELGHGLTMHTAQLIYMGESGGLNESMSDIMGAASEWWASKSNRDVKFNWSLAEKAFTPNNDDPHSALRFMDDPTRDGVSIDHYDNYPQAFAIDDMMNVHHSSGISNNAFYLLSEGGSNGTSGKGVYGGIGIEKSLRIFLRALTTYMTPQTDFPGARIATLTAASDLYGPNSAEVEKVGQAWDAVGVNRLTEGKDRAAKDAIGSGS